MKLRQDEQDLQDGRWNLVNSVNPVKRVPFLAEQAMKEVSAIGNQMTRG